MLSLVLTKAQVSPFNKVGIDSLGANYSFLVSGHFYGGSDNKSGYPANTLLGNLDLINKTEADFFICLGDLFKDVQNDRRFYANSLFSKLRMPLFNAVGNHDFTGDIYQKNYGETFFSFEVGNDLHIILDTEKNNGDLNTEQLSLIKKAESLSIKGDLNHLFIYGHRTIWKESFSELNHLFNDNTQSISSSNFETEVLPILSTISKNSTVHFFSGSMGGAAPASFFYYQNEQVNYIVTAIRALKRDAILKVNVVNKNISFETISLCGEELKQLESYNLDYWGKVDGSEGFNWRLLPLYVKTMLTHYMFWLGVLISTLVMFLVLLILKRRKTKVKPSH
jgi:hypothetical protein